MTVIHLRADDEAALKAACPFLTYPAADAGAGIEAGDWRSRGDAYDLVLIGAIELTPAVRSEDGETVIEPAVYDAGFHANLYPRAGFAETVPEAVTVHPVTPRRVLS